MRLGLALLAVALLAPGEAASDTNDVSPTREQVTERTEGLLAVWDALRSNVAGMRVRVDQDLLSSGEFDGARTWWVRSGLELEGGLPVGERLAIGIAPSFAWERLVIDGSDDFVISQEARDTRFTDFYDSRLRVGARYRIDDQWGAEAVTGFSARHEQGADYADAIQGGGSVAVTYRRGSWLRLRLGLGLGADLADGDLRLSPVYRIQIRPAPGWMIESSGLGGQVEWDATPRTTLSLGGDVDGTQYKLDRRGQPPAGSGDATLQRRQARVDLGIVHRLSESLRLRGGLGLVLDEQLSVLDEDGVEVDDRVERDPSVVLRFTLDLRI